MGEKEYAGKVMCVRDAIMEISSQRVLLLRKLT